MNVIIVHGSNDSEEEAKEGEGNNNRHWHPWIKKELKKRGIEVSGELYPKDWSPSYEEWKRIFEKNRINEETILIGHSSGCGFILKWLNATKTKVRKVILVAPYVTGADGYVPLKELNFLDFNEDMEDCFDELTILYSKDDSDVIIHDAKLIHDKLGGELLDFEDKGHFILEDMGTEEFPELIDEVVEK